MYTPSSPLLAKISPQAACRPPAGKQRVCEAGGSVAGQALGTRGPRARVPPGSGQTSDTSPQGGWAVSRPPRASAGRWLPARLVLGAAFAISHISCRGARVTESLSAYSFCPAERTRGIYDGRCWRNPIGGAAQKTTPSARPTSRHPVMMQKVRKGAVTHHLQLVSLADTALELFIEKYNFVSNKRKQLAIIVLS